MEHVVTVRKLTKATIARQWKIGCRKKLYRFFVSFKQNERRNRFFGNLVTGNISFSQRDTASV